MCSSYHRSMVLNGISGIDAPGGNTVGVLSSTGDDLEFGQSRGAVSRNTVLQNRATRPEDLRVTPWYLEEQQPDSSPGPYDPSSYPSYSYNDKDVARPDLASTRNNSVESEQPKPPGSAAPRKAYMDLRDAIALLDETCPNQEASPSLTPRTPRTPLTTHPRNKRARSKSSDNTSHYSNERLSDKGLDSSRSQDPKEKKRPFLRKIGISKTEDRPFLAKLAPRIISKPYLEKIGPSKAIEKPFLDKTGSSKTLDKFTFDIPRRSTPMSAKGTNPINKLSQVSGITPKPDVVQELPETTSQPQTVMESEKQPVAAVERRRSRKGYLLKMYSFETEDLNDSKGPRDSLNTSHRDPLRGASLDDVLDSGPSSLPPLEDTQQEIVVPNLQPKSTSVAELVKCKITSSEEIISSSSCLGSPREATSWGNSPKRKSGTTPETPTRRKRETESRDNPGNPGNGLFKTVSSPTKRRISNMSPEYDEDVFSKDLGASPTKTRRQASEDILDKMDDNKTSEHIMHRIKQEHFERRGISSDNLKLSKDHSTLGIVSSESSVRYQSQDVCKRDAFFEPQDSLTIGSKGSVASQDSSKEAFRQLHNKFELQNVPPESYGVFRRRAREARQTERQRILPRGIAFSQTDGEDSQEVQTALMSPGKVGMDSSSDTMSKERGHSVRSVLRKQENIEANCNDQEYDNKSLRRPKRKIFHEPSQETMDLLTELRKVKSLLKTPSVEKPDVLEDEKAIRLPKKILLTDKEFCLSIERENSVRRPSQLSASKDDQGNLMNTLESHPQEKSLESALNSEESDAKEVYQEEPSVRMVPGPALFEKRCLSLDYVDDERPQRPETRAISLVSARSPPSETEEAIDSSELALICDSKSYCSDVFNTPSEEDKDKDRSILAESRMNQSVGSHGNHCSEVDIAIPVDQKSSPKRRVQIQGRTSDLYEIISPRSTPFRVKKRLGRISVEETVKQESFTLGKVDCRSVVVQKRTKCFPL
ncbi:uncharacterized protein LOC107268954 [Cephus cinctus]|uniref:Uncharacterized protein LOC107268954 n=1 Tax=Cephus cinctus TaxID=211228 RepID=A0AAJ7W2C2_CEPCN|nr:uncharacterized protein LOC107268954 [Cephus cinctus]